MPNFVSLSGISLIDGSVVQKNNVLFKGIDACLDIDSIPQSATGQTSLFTGHNASKVLEYHLPVFPSD